MAEAHQLLAARLRRLLPGATAALPAQPGAYALALALPQPVVLARGRLAGLVPAGLYVYAGSARGPGGIAARVRRHIRRDKRIHWHIDALTATAQIAAVAVPDGAECAIVARLLAAGFHPAIAGFGSSDCRTCPSHLLTAGGASRQLAFAGKPIMRVAG